MKKNYMYLFLLLVPMSLFALSGKAQNRDTINIDLGPDNQNSLAPWNNINNAQTGSVADLLNSKGQATGLTIAITQPFNTWNLNGPTANDSLALPLSATRDSFYGNTASFNNTVIPFAALTLSNLDVTKAYSFAFFGSRNDVTDNRETLYTVEGAATKSAALNASKNTTRMAHVKGVMPKADGTITIVVKPGPNNNNTSGFFYLSGMRITYSNTVLGILPDVSAGNFQVYPNPASGSVSIRMEDGYKAEKVLLMNVAGQKVLEKAGSTTSGVRLDVGGLPSGLYYVQIQTNKGLFQTKLVLQ